MKIATEMPPSNFYPRPPRGGRLSARDGGPAADAISIHALREEGDILNEQGPVGRILFLSTPSARRATLEAGKVGSCCNNFYPRPPRGGRRKAAADFEDTVYISIHALREEGDLELYGLDPNSVGFLTTPPARRAT